nr:MAG TPA: hypothetical protein [Caudoviricetes sp.]
MNKSLNSFQPQEKECLFKAVINILQRGNDAEIKQSKHGIKVVEISKKVCMEIVNE